MGRGILEGVITVMFVGLILLNAEGFATAVEGAGTAYAGLVKGLQNR